MARKLKPYKVDHVVSPNGLFGADVFFDRDEKEFFVDITPDDLDSRVRADSLHEVKELARAALQRAQSYEWTAFIIVSTSEPVWFRESYHQCHAGLRLEFRRFERSPNPAYPDRFVERDHPLDLPTQEGPTTKRWREACAIRSYSAPSEEEVLLEYDQAAWDGLCAISRIIGYASERLRSVLQSSELKRLLRDAGDGPAALLLPPGER